jgi:hypothetical protein
MDGWLNPCPAGTFTRQETPSFAWRTNDPRLKSLTISRKEEYYGMTFVQWAVATRHDEELEEFIKAGYSIDGVYPKGSEFTGMTVLEAAEKINNQRIISLLRD